MKADVNDILLEVKWRSMEVKGSREKVINVLFKGHGGQNRYISSLIITIAFWVNIQSLE